MEPDHEEIRMSEDPDAQDYWEEGIMSEFLGALKSENVDHSQKVRYHYLRKGHIKANYPEGRKTGTQPWTK